MKNCTIFGLIFATIVILLYNIVAVSSNTCNPATQCEYDDSSVDPFVTCIPAPYGNTVDGCYGIWSSFSNCACETDYRISSTGVTYWCNSDGSWSPDIYSLQCYAPCIPDAKKPAIPSANPVQDGEYVQYSCPDGYESSGTSQVSCSDGVWSEHTVFECLASCNFPNNSLSNDETVTEPVDHGTAVSFTCIDGYIPLGTWIAECNDGTFDTDVICTIEECADNQCELDEESLDERLTYDAPTRYGNTSPPNYCYGKSSSIEGLSCTEDKWVVRPPTTIIYCDGSTAKWDYDIHNLTCHEPCDILSKVPNDVLTLDHHGNEAILFEHEQYVTYDCEHELATLVGTKKTTCRDGKWDNENVPECYDECYFPENASSTRGKTEPIAHGETVILQCDEGYEPRDTETVQCNDGTLSPNLVCYESV